jgi:addiction module RelE/StbE family toxin
MIIVWSDPAVVDLAALHAYVSTDNPAAAAAMVHRIVDLVERQLLRMPESGRPGRVQGTRELVVAGSPYFVPYRVTADRIEIIRVIHGARRWPDEQ